MGRCWAITSLVYLVELMFDTRELDDGSGGGILYL